MAVEDKFINENVAAGKLAKAIHSNGGKVFAMLESFEVAAADDDASIYRVFKNLPSDLIPLQITVKCDAITGGTDYDLGFYDTGVGGAIVDKDCLLNGQSLATASKTIDGLDDVSIADAEKMIYELAGKTTSNRKSGYDLCFTANTAGSAAGTITVMALFAQG